uniref:Uncharacterized protein n=1 Tax=Pyxicephalus adspersus TaxID=30357 RepID=A0AAV3A8D6_PYXAD|nr:TPA: hypothetical protein GDO54_017919 [Pyxicephalus adspersus]
MKVQLCDHLSCPVLMICFPLCVIVLSQCYKSCHVLFILCSIPAILLLCSHLVTQTLHAGPIPIVCSYLPSVHNDLLSPPDYQILHCNYL